MISVRDGGEGNERSAVMSGGGAASVSSGGVIERDYCRFPGVI